MPFASLKTDLPTAPAIAYRFRAQYVTGDVAGSSTASARSAWPSPR